MINVYLRKLTVTNDVYLNDPTAFAVVAPVVDRGGAGRQWREYEDYLARLRQEEEDEIILLICQAFITMEESCEHSPAA